MRFQVGFKESREVGLIPQINVKPACQTTVQWVHTGPPRVCTKRSECVAHGPCSRTSHCHYYQGHVVFPQRKIPLPVCKSRAAREPHTLPEGDRKHTSGVLPGVRDGTRACGHGNGFSNSLWQLPGNQHCMCVRGCSFLFTSDLRYI